MATKDYYFKGKLMWCMTTSPDKFNNWKVTLYPSDPEDIKTILELKAKGLKNDLRKDDDGYNITFRRPANKKVKGELRAFAAPVVLDKNNEPIADFVGNGSTGYVKVEVYDYKPPIGQPAKAARLVSIRVDDLVPYTRDSLGKDQKEEIKGLPEQKPLF